MIVVADAGPLLHLFWVGATAWALPPQEIAVVEDVWREVAGYAPGALADHRLRRVAPALPVSPLVADKRLHTGEMGSLSYALTRATDEQILILSDDQRARQACRDLALSFTGSIGLIVEAFRPDRVSKEVAEAALRDLPGRGRLYTKPAFITRVLAALDAEGEDEQQ